MCGSCTRTQPSLCWVLCVCFTYRLQGESIKTESQGVLPPQQNNTGSNCFPGKEKWVDKVAGAERVLWVDLAEIQLTFSSSPWLAQKIPNNHM